MQCRALVGTCALTLALLALLAPSPALAAFHREYLGKVTETPAGPLHVEAVAAGPEGDLWVGERTSPGRAALYEFDPAGVVVKTLDIASEYGMYGMAVNDATDEIYVGAIVKNEGVLQVYDQSGTLLRTIGLAGRLKAIAIDNSNNPLDPSAGDVYVTSQSSEADEIERFTEAGEPVPFEASGGPGGAVQSIAVDSQGEIYITRSSCVEGECGHIVLGYASSGRFLSELTGKGTPGVGGSHEELGWGGPVDGVAVDPASGRLLVAINHDHEPEREAAIDEFEPENGDRFSTQIAEALPEEMLAGGGAGEEGSLVAGPGGQIYLAHATGVYEFGSGRFFPSLRLGEPSQRTGPTATLNGAVDPESQQLSDCHFEYVSDAEFQAHQINEVQTVTVGAGGEGDLSEGSAAVSGVTATTGAFVVGEMIEGAGISAGTTITEVSAGTLTLSNPATASATDVQLTARPSGGTFALEFEGRSTGAEGLGDLDRTSVIEDVTNTRHFAVGEEVAGSGIPAGTIVTAVNVKEGKLELSNAATVTQKGVTLSASLPFDASKVVVERALEKVPSIGEGYVQVDGADGGPYVVTFRGILGDRAVSQLSGIAAGLTPNGTSVGVTVTTVGDDGWSSAKTAACEHPDATEIPVDSSFHAVHANVTGLGEGAAYLYRISATSTGELGGTEASRPLSFTAPAAPRIESTSATNFSSGYADLDATIDPLGAQTSYEFQYVSAADYNPAAEDPYAVGATAPAGPAAIGAGGATGSVAATAQQQIGGLAPGTTYHFRVVATNEIAEKGEVTYGPKTAYGPDETFTTLPAPSTGLPDGRAYELVTPADKGDAVDLFGSRQEVIETFGDPEDGFVSESGDSFLLAKTLAAFGPFPASEINAYLFTRTPQGWTYKSLASPAFGLQSLFLGAFDPSDFSEVALNALVGSVSSAEGHRDSSVVGPPDGPYSTMHVDAPVHTEAEETEKTTVVAGSHDLSSVVLESKSSALCPAASNLDPEAELLCEYSGGELRLVDAESKGKLLNRCGAVIGQGHEPGAAHDAVSADGSKVFFTAPDPYAVRQGPGCWNGGSGNVPELYMRSGGRTTEISAPERGAPEALAEDPALYVGASEDGSRVYFLSEGELTKDDAGIHDRELYEYDTETSKLTRISHGQPGDVAGDVHTVPAVASEGTAVYFTAFGALAPGASRLAPETQGNAPVNLYRYETASGSTTYVAPVNVGSYPDDATSSWDFGQLALSPEASWYTTPNGQYLLFATSHELTGYSTREANPDDCKGFARTEGSGGYCDEVYRYAAATGEVACLSCDPSGAPPVANALFSLSSGSLVPSAGPVRSMSNDGAYAFFETANPLVPGATNGMIDVYEWHEGRVSLISSGTDASPSFFLGASASGADVFIGTHANLVPEVETASKGNIFDARICTSSEPCPPPAAGEGVQCEGEACMSPPSAPNDATPASATFSGPGNAQGNSAEAKGSPGSAGKGQTRAQKLKRALKLCRKTAARKRRACERSARTRFGAKSKAKGLSRSNRKAGRSR